MALRAEIEQLRGKSREQAMLIDRLQRRLGHGYALAAPANGTSAEGEVTRAQRDISEAETVIDSVRAGAPEGDASSAVYEREIRTLRANAQDQAGEIARLKAALSAFEQQEGQPGGLKDSKIALKARLGSAQAQADQQAATIAKLRAELAATHERLARQAAHFMGEMRRIGTGGTAPPAPGQARLPARGGGRNLAERVAHAARTTVPASRTADGHARASTSGGQARRAGHCQRAQRQGSSSNRGRSLGRRPVCRRNAQSTRDTGKAPAAEPDRPHHRSGQELIGSWCKAGWQPVAGLAVRGAKSSSLRGVCRLAGAGVVVLR